MRKHTTEQKYSGLRRFLAALTASINASLEKATHCKYHLISVDLWNEQNNYLIPKINGTDITSINLSKCSEISFELLSRKFDSLISYLRVVDTIRKEATRRWRIWWEGYAQFRTDIMNE